MRSLPLKALVILGPVLEPALAAADSSRPRGVGPEFAKFYKDANTFSCIFNPSIQISAAQVNDDYCDCPDGSDEPGTAACSSLSTVYPPGPAAARQSHNTTLALPGFYCKNKGHQPSYVPFTNVNDGICDYELCCDGSDEWEGVGGVKCEDKCKEIGKEWKKDNEQRQKAMGAANRKRREITAEAARLRMEVEDRIKVLHTEIAATEVKVTGLKKELADVERKERGKVIKGPTTGGKIAVLTSLAKTRIQELINTLADVREQRDSLRARVTELEELLTTFKEEYNPNFNDEGVKRAVKKWEDYAAGDQDPEPEAAVERDIDQILKSDAENGLKWEEFEGQDDNEADVLYQFEEYLPKPLRDWVDGKLRDLRIFLVDSGVLASTPTDGSEPKAVSDAKQRLSSAENDLRDRQNELQRHQSDLETDYGPEEIFRALKGKCIERESGEYKYEFCWMDKTTQKSQKGGGHTGMGNFVRIEKIFVDEELPADGKGLGSGERYALKFENGQHCWNGPNRSTLVVLACSENDEIWKITEEEKCVYRMEVGTPVVCDANGNIQPPQRDEL